MARWKPTAAHYVHAEQFGQPTEWERQETNQQTGRMFRKVYKVPMYIHPDDPFCQNRHEGYCVMSHKGSEKPGDIVFFGPPTMDMEPLDDEAQAITDAEKHKWVDPITSLPLTIGEESASTILRSLENQVAVMGTAGVAHTLRGSPNKDIEDLKAMVAQQQAMINKMLLDKDAKSTPPIVEPDLPPVEADVPLTDPDPDAVLKPAPIFVKKPTPPATLRR